ncbi:MAG: nucleoside deaminase [Candidatus Limnocylindrales bacterium]
MRYEMYMSAALAEAAAAAGRGDRPDGAVAVLDDAMVASAADGVRTTGDPTAHAVIVTLREAADRMGTTSLAGLTVYVVVEPCVMCVGALLESDVDGIVYALPDPLSGAAGSALQLARNGHLGRHLDVVSGILQADASELVGRSALARAAQ